MNLFFKMISSERTLARKLSGSYVILQGNIESCIKYTSLLLSSVVDNLATLTRFPFTKEKVSL